MRGIPMRPRLPHPSQSPSSSIFSRLCTLTTPPVAWTISTACRQATWTLCPAIWFVQPWKVHSRDPGRANSLHRSTRAFNDWTDGQIEYELVHRTSIHIWTILFLLPFTIMSTTRVSMRVLTATVAIASVAALAIGTATAHGTEYPEDISLVLQTHNRSSPLYSYPTDLTREVVPVSVLHYSSHRMSPEQALTITESNPLSQWLLARSSLLYCPLIWLHQRRSWRMALQRDPICWPRTLCAHPCSHLWRPLHPPHPLHSQAWEPALSLC